MRAGSLLQGRGAPAAGARGSPSPPTYELILPPPLLLAPPCYCPQGCWAETLVPAWTAL